MPHWDGCRERGPLTFRVFSNWEEIRVIMPSAEMKDRRERTWVTPCRSILNRFRDQLPWRRQSPQASRPLLQSARDGSNAEDEPQGSTKPIRTGAACSVAVKLLDVWPRKHLLGP